MSDFSIAHFSERERQFLITLVINALPPDKRPKGDTLETTLLKLSGPDTKLVALRQTPQIPSQSSPNKSG